jgi:hypothetical protein
MGVRVSSVQMFERMLMLVRMRVIVRMCMHHVVMLVLVAMSMVVRMTMLVPVEMAIRMAGSCSPLSRCMEASPPIESAKFETQSTIAIPLTMVQ